MEAKESTRERGHLGPGEAPGQTVDGPPSNWRAVPSGMDFGGVMDKDTVKAALGPIFSLGMILQGQHPSDDSVDSGDAATVLLALVERAETILGFPDASL